MTERAARGHYFQEGCTFPLFQNQQVIIVITEMEQQVIIRNNDLLFHVSDLPFHLLKIITCSKQWKGALMFKRSQESLKAITNKPHCRTEEVLLSSFGPQYYTLKTTVYKTASCPLDYHASKKVTSSQTRKTRPCLPSFFSTRSRPSLSRPSLVSLIN